MYKERNSLHADFGKVRPDGSFNGSSYGLKGTTGWNFPTLNVEPILRSAWAQGPYNLNVSTTGLRSCTETFFSTERKRPAWNDCKHFKSNRYFSYPWVHIQKSGWATCQVYYTEQLGFPRLSSDPVVPKSIAASDFTRARAWAAMQPRFESDFQTLNFLFELKDFRNIASLLGDIIRPGSPFYKRVTLKGFADNVKELKRKSIPILPHRNTGKPPTVAEALDGALDRIAEAQLLKSFLIDPLLKDAAALSAALATEYTEALKKFKSDGEDANTRHYSEMLLQDDRTIATWTARSGLVTRDVKSSLFTATLQYQYKYNLTDTSRAFAKYWGLTGTTEEFWNMVPFGFLLDYVLQISNALKYSDVDKDLDLTAVNYCESILTTVGRRYELTKDPLKPQYGVIVDGIYYPPPFDKPIPLAGHVGTYYTRTNTDPLRGGLILPRWKTPSVNQWYNIGALAKLILF